jgi:tetratricopeptide (TPR) repeat protein
MRRASGPCSKGLAVPERFPLDSAPGPARSLSREDEDALVRGALARILPSPAPVSRRGPAARRSSIPIAASIAAALIAAVAIAAELIERRSPSSSAGERLSSAKAHGPSINSPSIPERPEQAPSLEAATQPDPAPAIESAAPVREGRSPQIERRRAETSPERRGARGMTVLKPIDHLAMANGLRAARRWRAAERAYLSVIREHLGSEDAYTAHVAAAQLELEHLGDPRAALAHLEDARRASPNGPLAQEIDYTIAEVYRALGDVDREATALRSFLSAHPSASRAVEARARLREVSPGSP